MKKFLIVITLLVMVLILASCNDYSTYDYAIVNNRIYSIDKITINGYQIKIITKENKEIFTHLENVILVKE